MAAEVKASTSCAGGAWGKMAAIREDEQKLLWAAITRSAKGSARLKRRKIGGEKSWVKKGVVKMGKKRCVWVLKPHPGLRVVLSNWLSTRDECPSSKFIRMATLSTYHRLVVVVVVVSQYTRKSLSRQQCQITQEIFRKCCKVPDQCRFLVKLSEIIVTLILYIFRKYFYSCKSTFVAGSWGLYTQVANVMAFKMWMP